VLDLGSGAGNTIFALHAIYPNARVIATDLSLPLLRILRTTLERQAEDFVHSIVQMNAEQIIYRDRQFDLVVGGSILHHLFDPRETLRECYRVLKPEGSAVFFEPFEIGYQLITLLFKQLIRMNEYHSDSDRLTGDTVAYFKALCKDHDHRKGDDKSADTYKYVEDKWLFTRGYFEDVARSIGFEKVVIESSTGPGTSFMGEILALLRIGLGADACSLPSWVRDVIDEYDGNFSGGMRRELLFSGSVVFKRGKGSDLASSTRRKPISPTDSTVASSISMP
jgi:ubiquinone/menaquinone biosynthesis C-methylase UbiE